LIKSIINSQGIDLKEKIIATRSLEKRLSIKNDAEVNNFIHQILSNEDYDEAIKVEAIKAQTAREHVMETRSSLEEMKRVLQDEDSTAAIQSAATNYFNEVGVNPLSIEVEESEDEKKAEDDR
jgi:hypothetical protein